MPKRIINITEKIKMSFSSFERTIKNLIFIFIPFMTFSLILSDRTPYNYFALGFYGIEMILIILYVIRFHKFVFDFMAQLLLAFLLSILLSQLLNFKLLLLPKTIFLLSLFSVTFYQFVITLSQEEKATVFKLFIVGGLFFVVFFVCHYAKSLIHLNFGDRLGIDLSDQNDLAKNMSLLAIISEVFVVKSRFRDKFLYGFFGALFAFIVLITGSISNLLLLILLSIFFLIYSTRGKKRIFTIVGIFVFCILFILALQLPILSYFKTRLLNMINSFFYNGGNIDNSLVDRFNLAMNGFKLFLSRPVFGYGYDQVQYYAIGENVFSHNNFIELLASFGLIGFSIFEIMLCFPIYKCWKKKNSEFVLITLLYLFFFQPFLIIFRKKFEYLIIPLAFSYISDSFNQSLTISFSNKKVVFSKIFHVNRKNAHYSLDI